MKIVNLPIGDNPPKLPPNIKWPEELKGSIREAKSKNPDWGNDYGAQENKSFLNLVSYVFQLLKR
jgi:hypothetical protein